MKTGTANNNGPQSENGPSSFNDSEGRRNTPEPTTELMHMATSPQKPTVRISFGVWLAFMPAHGGEKRTRDQEQNPTVKMKVAIGFAHALTRDKCTRSCMK